MFDFHSKNTFCINLERRPDRWEKMNKIFIQAKLQVTRWNASEPKDIVDNIQGSPTQKACSQSHIRVWKHIVENNLEYALVMEDDVTFDKEWRKRLKDFKKLNKPFHLLLLNTDHFYGLHQWANTQGDSWLTGAYIITNRCARILLELGYQKGFLPSDHMFISFQKFSNNEGCFSYFPYLAIQTSIESDISGSSPEFSYSKVVDELQRHHYSLDHYFNCQLSIDNDTNC